MKPKYVTVTTLKDLFDKIDLNTIFKYLEDINLYRYV